MKEGAVGRKVDRNFMRNVPVFRGMRGIIKRVGGHS